MWPKFQDLEDFQLEMSSYHYLRKEGMAEMKRFIHEKLINYGAEDAETFREAIIERFSDYVDLLQDEYDTNFESEPARDIDVDSADE